LNTRFVASLDGRCHTLNRYSCDVDSTGYKNYLKTFKDLASAHLYHDSVSCARDVLSGKFISFSLISMILYALLF
jgi:hypothetical protein